MANNADELMRAIRMSHRAARMGDTGLAASHLKTANRRLKLLKIQQPTQVKKGFKTPGLAGSLGAGIATKGKPTFGLKVAGHDPLAMKKPKLPQTAAAKRPDPFKINKRDASEKQKRAKHYGQMSGSLATLGTAATGVGAGSAIVGELERRGHDPMGFAQPESHRHKPLTGAKKMKVLKPMSEAHRYQAKTLGAVGLTSLGLAGAYKYKKDKELSKRSRKENARSATDTALAGGAAVVSGGALHHGMRNSKMLYRQANDARDEARAAHHLLAAKKAKVIDMGPKEAQFQRGVRATGARVAGVKYAGALGAATAAAAGGATLYELARRGKENVSGVHKGFRPKPKAFRAPRWAGGETSMKTMKGPVSGWETVRRTRTGGKVFRAKTDFHKPLSNDYAKKTEQRGGGLTTGATVVAGGAVAGTAGLAGYQHGKKKKQVSNELVKGYGMSDPFEINKAQTQPEWNPNKSFRAQGLAYADKAGGKATRKQARRNSRTFLPGEHQTENLKTLGRHSGTGAAVGAALGAAAFKQRGGGALLGGTTGALVGEATGTNKINNRAFKRAVSSSIASGHIKTGQKKENVTLLGNLRKALTAQDRTEHRNAALTAGGLVAGGVGMHYGGKRLVAAGGRNIKRAEEMEKIILNRKHPAHQANIGGGPEGMRNKYRKTASKGVYQTVGGRALHDNGAVVAGLGSGLGVLTAGSAAVTSHQNKKNGVGVKKSAFGVEDPRLELSKADTATKKKKPPQPASGGRYATGMLWPGIHGAVAGEPGRKLRATGMELGGSIAGGGLGAVVAGKKGQVVGDYAGRAAAVHQNQKLGYYKKQKLKKNDPFEVEKAFSPGKMLKGKKTLTAIGGAKKVTAPFHNPTTTRSGSLSAGTPSMQASMARMKNTFNPENQRKAVAIRRQVAGL